MPDAIHDPFRLIAALQLTIEAPVGAQFKLERLEAQSRANAKPGALKRLSFELPVAAEVRARVRMGID